MAPGDPRPDGRRCGLCDRAVPRTTRHHLVPVSRTRKRRRRGQLERGPDGDAVRGAPRPAADAVVDLCPACHGMVHAVLSEKALEASFHSLEALRGHPEIARFVAWVARQPADRRVSVRWPRERRGR